MDSLRRLKKISVSDLERILSNPGMRGRDLDFLIASTKILVEKLGTLITGMDRCEHHVKFGVSFISINGVPLESDNGNRLEFDTVDSAILFFHRLIFLKTWEDLKEFHVSLEPTPDYPGGVIFEHIRLD